MWRRYEISFEESFKVLQKKIGSLKRVWQRPLLKSKKFYKSGENKLIRNYGIGAQIIKFLGITKMILVTRSKKKVIGLDGYGIKITKQEIIKWKLVLL